ncbi:P-loop NTPase fold protein [Sphingomonas sp.]|uniref:KAP family P-loop NTPase fold protein n=1 Tax=Sphingomonas sp. TaxID=28214 RepID=UPI001B01B293|nr:P-loop NTPase fold protein [Sphingomonas sp.]MBO9712977.1 hypothetical protein [Sphingomonas sp.]
METLDEIWDGDLLGRRGEAEDLVGFLESVTARPSIREDGHAYVLAVDASYGQGKTFFLRRLARHMAATEHAVAFVDAWVDDLEDEPMVALAATLETALEPWIEKDRDVAEGLARFRAKAGRVAKIVGTGLLKRGVGFLITQGAAEALGSELDKAGEVARDIDKDALKGAGAGMVDDAAKALGEIATPSMEARIQRFREGQQAIREMKEGLGEIVEALVAAGMKLPVTIIIDELDRCRPTYAIKLLEEVKHLFDVAGVAFVLGLHGEQLAHSVTAAYGTGFDGNAYLRRFFSRRYALRDAPLKPLIDKLFQDLVIPTQRLVHPPIVSTSSLVPDSYDASSFIAAYMDAYGLKARDAFQLMEMLQTSAALTASNKLLLVYLIPLIIAHMTNVSLPTSDQADPKWHVAIARTNKSPALWHPDKLAAEIDKARRLHDEELENVSSSPANLINPMIARIRSNLPDDSYARPENYRRLIQTAKRFTSSEGDA